VAGNGAVYTIVPDPPVSVVEDRTGKTATTLNLVWSDGPSNGGLSIVDYKVSIRD
jgi:hypothetical protein